MGKPVYEIDGKDFKNIDEFYVVISRVFGIDPNPNAANLRVLRSEDRPAWGHNLDAFNDILRGGFGDHLGEPLILKWKNHEISKQKIREFPTIVRIIKEHGPGGRESLDGIDLILE